MPTPETNEQPIISDLNRMRERFFRQGGIVPRDFTPPASLSNQLRAFVTQIEQMEGELKNAQQGGEPRATLIVNFGKTHGKVMKVVDEDLTFHKMLVKVLEHLMQFVPDECNGLKTGTPKQIPPVKLHWRDNQVDERAWCNLAGHTRRIDGIVVRPEFMTCDIDLDDYEPPLRASIEQAFKRADVIVRKPDYLGPPPEILDALKEQQS